jgi:hypothetical protein
MAKGIKTVFSYSVYETPWGEDKFFMVKVTRVHLRSAIDWMIKNYPRPRYEFELCSTQNIISKTSVLKDTQK